MSANLCYPVHYDVRPSSLYFSHPFNNICPSVLVLSMIDYLVYIIVRLITHCYNYPEFQCYIISSFSLSNVDV